MAERSRFTRRRVLVAAAASAGTVGLAGCAGGDATGSGTDRDTDADPTTAGTGATGADGNGGLDLREANVTGVAVAEVEGGYRFDVTLYHDDDGEEGYANWWQVERRDGTRLGRRELVHAHGTRAFTRSATVAVPDGVACVVVRGHDRTHGYGGRAMVVTLATGATRAIDQGPEPDAVADASCP